MDNVASPRVFIATDSVPLRLALWCPCDSGVSPVVAPSLFVGDATMKDGSRSLDSESNENAATRMLLDVAPVSPVAEKEIV